MGQYGDRQDIEGCSEVFAHITTINSEIGCLS